MKKNSIFGNREENYFYFNKYKNKFKNKKIDNSKVASMDPQFS